MARASKPRSPPPEPPTPTPTPPPPSSCLLTHLVNLDTTLSRQLHRLFNPILPHPFLKLLEISGDGRLWFPLSIALLLSPLSLHSPHLYSFSLCLLLGLLSDLAIIGSLKHLARRPRPTYNAPMGPTFAVDHWSFPSGHASRVCFVAALSLLFLDHIADGLEQVKMRKGEIVERWIGEWEVGRVLGVWGVGLVVWAVVTASSRVVMGRHYVVDVVVGAWLGLVNGWVVYQFLRFEIEI